MNNFAAVIGLLFLFAGCSASGPGFQDTPYAKQQAPEDKARIIFLRQDDSYIGGRWARLDVDGAPVGKVAREGFLVIDTAPGEREISVAEDEAKNRLAVKMSLEPGQTYYLRVYRHEGLSTWGGTSSTVEATGVFALIGGLFTVFRKDDQATFQLEPLHPWLALKMLEGLKLSE